LIGFLDTSALVPLLIAEPGSVACQRFWNDADILVAVGITYVEAATALAEAERLGRLTSQDLESSLSALERLWRELDIVEVDETLIRRSAEVARQLGLRAFDAVQCAAAEQLADDSLVAATGDRRLITAWSQLGVSTYDTEA
jgi:predicted nucleic acid-binding protein